MFTAIEKISAEEIALRHSRCRDLLRRLLPDAGGVLVFSRQALYHLSGHIANGLLWIPADDDREAILLCRRGIERARLESPLRTLSFRSYSELPHILNDAGSPMSATVGAEMGGLSWSMANLLQRKLHDRTFLSADAVLARTRAVKTPWELAKLRLCGERHHRCLHDLLPEKLSAGMTEREVAHAAWEVFFANGHSGHMRMGTLGDEIFLGHIAAGDSANYPSIFDGPVGLRGEHPAVPFGGYAGSVWKAGTPLAVDIGFSLEGYQTDKTQVLWAGSASSITDEAKAGHRLCIDVQNWIAQRLVPGARPSELYAGAMKLVEDRGMLDGFMALDANNVQFIGHGIGLAIDEWPVIACGFDEPLERGMCLALEPKFGIRGLGMVGVENTFEVTPEGGRPLTGQDYEIVCVN